MPLNGILVFLWPLYYITLPYFTLFYHSLISHGFYDELQALLYAYVRGLPQFYAQMLFPTGILKYLIRQTL